MGKFVVSLLLGFFALVLASPARAQTQIETLFSKFLQKGTTDSAAQEIVGLTEAQPSTRDYLAQMLPPIITDRPSDRIWTNAVYLVSQLKITAALPALKQALSRSPVPVPGPENEIHSLSKVGTLQYDVVGKALADLGDASVPALADPLETGDPSMRTRVVWILKRINSPAAKGLMLNHLARESEPRIKKLIQSAQ